MFTQIVSMLLVVLCIVNPLLAVSLPSESVTIGNQLKVMIANSASRNQIITATLPIRKHIKGDWDSWVEQEKLNGALASAESTLLGNESSFVSGDTDNNKLYALMKSHGSKFTLSDIQKMATTTKEQRQSIVDSVKAKGLYATLKDVPKGTAFTHSPQPADGDCYLEDAGNAIMALAAIFAIIPGQQEVALALAALGGAMYLYGAFIDCYLIAVDNPFFQ